MQKKPIIVMTVFATLALAPLPAIAGPEGTYGMTGTNPGDNTQYKGLVTVEKTGGTYAVTWRFGKDEIRGIGTVSASSDKTFAVSYDSAKSHGIALYEMQSDGSWHGIWTVMSGKVLGTETWRAQQDGTTATAGTTTVSTPARATGPDGTGSAQQ